MTVIQKLYLKYLNFYNNLVVEKYFRYIIKKKKKPTRTKRLSSKKARYMLNATSLMVNVLMYIRKEITHTHVAWLKVQLVHTAF